MNNNNPRNNRHTSSRREADMYLWLGSVSALLVAGGIIVWLMSATNSPKKSPKTKSKVTSIQNNMPGAPPVKQSSGPAKAPSSTDELAHKLNAYIACLQSYEDARHSMERYFSWRKDPLQAPNCLERKVHRGILPIYPNHVEDCEMLISNANKIPPAIPHLHEAGKAYLKILENFMPLVKQASGYYAKRRYLEDDCLKGRVFHPQLLKKFEKLTERYWQLYELVAAHAEGGLERCVLHTKDDQRQQALHRFANVTLTVQEIVNKLAKQAKKKSPDPVAVAQLIETTQQSIDAFNSLPDDVQDTHDGEVFDNFLDATKAFIDTDAGQAPDQKSLGIRIKNGMAKPLYRGTLDHVMEAFHGLLKRYNHYARNHCTTLLPCDDNNNCPPR